jgi:hypothetical protein
LVRVLVPTVVILWQVPHTIVLRFTLLVVLGLLSWPRAVAALARPASPGERLARQPFGVFALFVAWCLAVSFAMSPELRASLSELRAQWLAPTLILLMGYGLALRYGTGNAVVRVAFLGLMLHAFMHLVSFPVFLARGGSFPYPDFPGISNHRANVTYTNALALAMLVADAYARAGGHRGFLGIGARWAVAAFALLLASSVAATTRNGLIVFGLLAAAGFVLLAMRMRARATRTAWITLGGCALVAVAGTVAGLRAEPRWSSFMDTLPVAWDTDSHREWLWGEHNLAHLPKTAAGAPVEPSAYYRIAYLREGARLMLDNPFGNGVGRDAYRYAIEKKYGMAGMSHSHSGFVDLGASVGIPGLALFIAFLAALCLYAKRAPESGDGGLALALVLVVAGYAVRTALDSTLRDHVIQQFMLVAGLIMGTLASGERRGDG